MTNKKETIEYEQYLNILNEHARLKKIGVEFIKNRSLIKIVAGYVFIGVGVVTLPLPTGSVFLIGVGCGFVGWGFSDIIRLKKSLVNTFRYYRNKKRCLRW